MNYRWRINRILKSAVCPNTCKRFEAIHFLTHPASLLVHSPCCCVGVAVAAEVGAGLWLLFLSLATFAHRHCCTERAHAPHAGRHPCPLLSSCLGRGLRSSPWCDHKSPRVSEITLCHPWTLQGDPQWVQPFGISQLLCATGRSAETWKRSGN